MIKSPIKIIGRSLSKFIVKSPIKSVRKSPVKMIVYQSPLRKAD